MPAGTMPAKTPLPGAPAETYTAPLTFTGIANAGL
jgi:hypothetical protein